MSAAEYLIDVSKDFCTFILRVKQSTGYFSSMLDPEDDDTTIHRNVGKYLRTRHQISQGLNLQYHAVSTSNVA